MSLFVACAQSPIRVVNDCGVLVIPQESDLDKMNAAGVSAEFFEQINNNQDAHELCLEGLDG